MNIDFRHFVESDFKMELSGFIHYTLNTKFYTFLCR